MFKLKSRDMMQTFSNIPEWFYDAFHYTQLGEHREAYIQNHYSGSDAERMMLVEFNADYSGILAKTKTNRFRNVNYDYSGTITCCNIAVRAYCSFFGRNDLANGFFQLANAAIDELILESGYGDTGITLLNGLPEYVPGEPCMVYQKQFYIAGQKVKDGHGHVAPVIGYGKDGVLYVANIGAFPRHGIVPVAGRNWLTAFYADLDEIQFFKIDKG